MKRIYRLCQEEGLGIRSKRRGIRVSGPLVVLPVAHRPQER